MVKAKRVTALFLVIIMIAINIQARPARVQAFAPVIVGGVTISAEVIAYVAALLVAGGISFSSQAEAENAIISMAHQNPAFMTALIGYTAGQQLEIGKTVTVAVSEVKDFFAETVDFYRQFFQSDKVGSGTSAISTSYASYVVKYIDGYMFADYPGFPINNSHYADNYDGLYFGNGPAIMNWHGHAVLASLGHSYKGNIGGIDIDASFDISYNAHGNPIIYATINGVRTNIVVGFPASYTNLSFDYGFVLYAHSNGSSSFGAYYYSTGLYNGKPYVSVDRCQLTSLSLPILSAGMFTPSFTADVADVNVLQDTADFGATVGAIGNVLGGKVLTDEDKIGITLPGNLTGLTLPDVIAGAGTVDVPADKDKDTDKDKETDVPSAGGILGLLGGITGLLDDIWQAVKSLPKTIVGEGELDYTRLKLSSSALPALFPFCVPFDFVNALGALYATPAAPVFEMDFSGTMFGDYVWRLDMSEFEDIAVVVRWCVWIGCLVGLMLNTGRFIKW